MKIRSRNFQSIALVFFSTFGVAINPARFGGRREGKALKRILPAVGLLGWMLLADPAHSQFLLTPVPGLPGLSSGSVAWGDYDNDGRLDFLISGLDGVTGLPQLLLWRSTGSGFSNVTTLVAPGLPGIFDSAVAWGDLDNDRRLDFLITGLTNVFSAAAVSQVWRNSGSGFTNLPVPGLPGVAQSAAAWSDFDNDGRLDFLITGTTNGNSSGAISQLWRNTGSGFTNVPIPGLAGVYFGSLAWGDADNDGRTDFLITGITNGSSSDATTQLWRNTEGGFTNVPIPGLRGVFVSSVAWGDYNNDSRLDFLLEGLSANGFISQLWRNTGQGFTNEPVPGLAGIADGSLAWGDYDNDGRLDFLITGLANGATRVTDLWRNTGSGFTQVPVPGLPGIFDNLLAWGDYDNDGRLDFLVAGTIAGGNVSQLWRNNLVSSNSPPLAPAGLASVIAGTTARLQWDPPSDEHTPAGGLSYNVRLGTTPGGADLVSTPALTNGVLLLPRMGAAQNRSIAFDSLLPGQTYYWSVQAVDSGFVGSAFATEEQFSIGPTIGPLLLHPIRHPNGIFEFGFTGPAGASFIALATSNPGPNTWTILGSPTEVSPGQFQFVDPQAPTHSQRFYQVRSL